MAARHCGIIADAGPGHPGHSFCAISPHFPNAPCALLPEPSLLASPSLHVSASLQRVYGGRALLVRYLLMVATQTSAGVVPALVPLLPLPPALPDDELDVSPLLPLAPDDVPDRVPLSEPESSLHAASVSRTETRAAPRCIHGA